SAHWPAPVGAQDSTPHMSARPNGHALVYTDCRGRQWRFQLPLDRSCKASGDAKKYAPIRPDQSVSAQQHETLLILEKRCKCAAQKIISPLALRHRHG